MQLSIGLSFCVAVIISMTMTMATKPPELSDLFNVTSRSGRKNPVADVLDRMENIRKVISFGTQLTDVYNRLTNPEEPDYNQKYAKYLSHMTDELEGIKVNLNGVSSFLSRQEPLGCSYSLAEIQIMTALRRFHAYNQSSSSAFLKEEFLKSSAELQVSIEHLLAGLNGDYVINADIIRVTRDELDCRQHPLNEKIGRFMGLVKTGLEMHENYVQVANISDEENAFFLERVSQSYDRVNYRIRREIENCVSEKNVQRDIRQVIATNFAAEESHGDLAQLSTGMVNYLTEKYSYRTWLVCLNKRKEDVDPVSWHKQMTSEQFFRIADRTNRIDVVALSTDRRFPKLLSAQQKEMLSTFFYFEVFEAVDGGQVRKCVELDPQQDQTKDSPFHFTCSQEQLGLTVTNYRTRIRQIIGSDFAHIVLNPLQYVYGELPSSVHLFNAARTSLLIIPV